MLAGRCTRWGGKQLRSFQRADFIAWDLQSLKAILFIYKVDWCFTSFLLDEIISLCDAYSLRNREFFFDRSPRVFEYILGIYRKGNTFKQNEFFSSYFSFNQNILSLSLFILFTVFRRRTSSAFICLSSRFSRRAGILGAECFTFRFTFQFG